MAKQNLCFESQYLCFVIVNTQDKLNVLYENATRFSYNQKEFKPFIAR